MTLQVVDITAFGALWDVPTNRGKTNDHSGSMPQGMTWNNADFGGQPVYATTIDPRDGTIYAATTVLYDISASTPNPTGACTDL